MALRDVNNWRDLNNALRELFSFKDTQSTTNLDFHQRQIKNAHVSIDDYDYVVRKELVDRLGEAVSTFTRPNLVKTYDKATFGIGVGSPAVVGTKSTPPFIWSNSSSGRPEIGFIAANIPPTGSDLIVDVNKLGVSILTGGKIHLPVGTPSITTVSFSNFVAGTVFSRGDVLSPDVTQVGSGNPGQEINIVIFCKLV